eukprot:scaffold65438_cov72-Phaeocystis_antarctica.AAC.1
MHAKRSGVSPVSAPSCTAAFGHDGACAFEQPRLACMQKAVPRQVTLCERHCLAPLDERVEQRIDFLAIGFDCKIAQTHGRLEPRVERQADRAVRGNLGRTLSDDQRLDTRTQRVG